MARRQRLSDETKAKLAAALDELEAALEELEEHIAEERRRRKGSDDG